MKILILNGSPHMHGNTSKMTEAFAKSAEEAGHSVMEVRTAFLKVAGCRGCEYCRTKEKGVCVQKDDMQEIYEKILASDMIVFASPIYYFSLSAQLQAVIQRTYAIDIPKNVRKTALFLSSGSKYVYGPAVTQYLHSLVEYWGVENVGIYMTNEDENDLDRRLEEIRAFAGRLA
ncbi:MAG: flavodoxin family protein [Solobacterium sp.]|nr:flavodoxin family protein [Solobacterium sp.]